jgi:alkylhydroperoxidase/carboxymuconolactone decarboxylase family protein YurZ
MAEKITVDKGREVAKRLFGEKAAEMAEESLSNMNPGFEEFVMMALSVYDRPALDMKTRSAMTMAVLTALGRTQEMTVHVRAALNVGLTEEQIREVIMQVAVYAGIPVAIEAYQVANRVFEKVRGEAQH